KNRIEVIPNAIHLISFKEDDEFKRTEIKKKYNLKEDDRIILFVGRVASEKSIDKIIKVLEIIKKRDIS
ncbi:unnamed protein product, partial [marine sediment metagenome]